MIVRRMHTTIVRTQGDTLMDALMGALHDVDVQLRNEYPDLFAEVDAIKEGRRGEGEGFLLRDRRMNPGRLYDEGSFAHATECAWCGDFFLPARSSRKQTCCSHECRGHYTVWRNRRNEMWCAWCGKTFVPHPTPGDDRLHCCSIRCVRAYRSWQQRRALRSMQRQCA